MLNGPYSARQNNTQLAITTKICLNELD